MRLLTMSFGVLFALSSIAHAELDTFTYVSIDGSGTGDYEGDISGEGPLTLLDADGGDMWNDGDNFAYVHEGEKRHGSFKATVRVVSQTEAIDGRWGKAGIRASASLEGDSANAQAQVAVGNGSQIDPPSVGDHSPVPVRLAGRTLNELPNGFEDPIIAAPGTDAPVDGDGNVANNVFPSTGETNASWLSLEYNAATNEFIAGYAIDVDGSPGVWNFSAPRSDIEPSPDGGWFVGLAYSAHSDLNFDQVTREDNLHGVTFDNFSAIPEPSSIVLVLLGAVGVFGLVRRRR